MALVPLFALVFCGVVVTILMRLQQRADLPRLQIPIPGGIAGTTPVGISVENPNYCLDTPSQQPSPSYTGAPPTYEAATTTV